MDKHCFTDVEYTHLREGDQNNLSALGNFLSNWDQNKETDDLQFYGHPNSGYQGLETGAFKSESNNSTTNCSQQVRIAPKNKNCQNHGPSSQPINDQACHNQPSCQHNTRPSKTNQPSNLGRSAVDHPCLEHLDQQNHTQESSMEAWAGNGRSNTTTEQQPNFVTACCPTNWNLRSNSHYAAPQPPRARPNNAHGAWGETLVELGNAGTNLGGLDSAQATIPSV